MTEFPPHLSQLLIKQAVESALLEDLGRAGDITTNATIPENAVATCVLATRDDGIVSGVELARTAFLSIDPTVEFSPTRKDCDAVRAGDELINIKGKARSILSAERVALNFLMRMSGIASYTAEFAKQIAHTNAQICCTRKTVPGHRAFDKYAVKCGGGANHRFGLDDAILIKDNHIAVAGGVSTAIQRARAYAGHLVKVEVEVDNLEQFEVA
ncbi:MAG: carboxylating nicotinate-nucleotide diphosphorylase, partial [Pseudomonadota bacterium]